MLARASQLWLVLHIIYQTHSYRLPAGANLSLSIDEIYSYS